MSAIEQPVIKTYYDLLDIVRTDQKCIWAITENVPVCFMSYEYCDCPPAEIMDHSLKEALKFVERDITIQINEWNFTEMGKDRFKMES
jgi:hypothetical protein